MTQDEQPPEHQLSDADRDFLDREDSNRDRRTLRDLIDADLVYATKPVELVDVALDDDTEAGLDNGDPTPSEPDRGVPHRFGIGNASVASHMRAIAKICRDRFGLQVKEHPGWATRGRSSVMRPTHVIAHHTAATVDVTNLLINGRPDVTGPLCNWALLANGTVVLIASGRANHAGVASISSSASLGIEATGPKPITSSGPGAFPNYQAYVKLVAAHLLHYGWPIARVSSHKEIARPAGRKIDPSFDMRIFRNQVLTAVQGSASGPTRPPTPPKGWDQVATKAEIQAVVRDVVRAEVPSLVKSQLHWHLYRALLQQATGQPNGGFNADNAPELFKPNAVSSADLHALLKTLSAQQ